MHTVYRFKIHLLTLLIWWVAPEFPIIFISLFTILLEEKKIKCISIGSQYNDIVFWRSLFETAIMDLFFRSILMMKSMAWCTLKYPLIWIMTGDCLGFINLEAGVIIYLWEQWKQFSQGREYREPSEYFCKGRRLKNKCCTFHRGWKEQVWGIPEIRGQSCKLYNTV